LTRIIIQPVDIRGDRGQRYAVLLGERVLVYDTRCPEHDAARALLALGITGRVEVLRGDKVAATMDVETAAGFTIVENVNTGPAVGRWKPFADDYVPPPAADQGRSGTRVAADENGGW
jgi:hypothetical protein